MKRLLVALAFCASCSDLPPSPGTPPDNATTAGTQPLDAETERIIESVRGWLDERHEVGTVGILDEGRTSEEARAVVLNAGKDTRHLRVRLLDGTWTVAEEVSLPRATTSASSTRTANLIMSRRIGYLQRMTSGGLDSWDFSHAYQASGSGFVYTSYPDVAPGSYEQYWNADYAQPEIQYIHSGSFDAPSSAHIWIPVGGEDWLHQFTFQKWQFGGHGTTSPCAWVSGSTTASQYFDWPYQWSPECGHSTWVRLFYRIDHTETACPVTVELSGPTSVVLPGSVTFSATASSGACGGAHSYSWWLYRHGNDFVEPICSSGTTCSVQVNVGDPSFSVTAWATRSYSYGYSKTAYASRDVNVNAKNPPTVSISGPQYVRPYYVCTWEGSASGGDAPYLFSWSGRLSGSGPSITGGISRSGGLTLTVTDAAGRVGQAYYPIEAMSAYPPGCGN